jgi:hypothetical protein
MEVLSTFILHILLQHLSVVVGDGLQLCVRECILYDFTSVVENEARFRIGYTISQLKSLPSRRGGARSGPENKNV